MAGHKVAVFGVPTAAGAHGAGVARAPFALRAAGLLSALKEHGATVVNLSDLSLFPYREDPDHPRARNAEVVACALRATADEMTRALGEGFTVVLGGDCTLAAAAAAGAGQALGEEVGLVFIDANADLNTPETTPWDTCMGWPWPSLSDAAIRRSSPPSGPGPPSSRPTSRSSASASSIRASARRSASWASRFPPPRRASSA